MIGLAKYIINRRPVCKHVLIYLLMKGRGIFIAIFFLLIVGVKSRSQDVVITEVSNQAITADEWVELLVITDDVDMRNWSIRDYSLSGNAQVAVTFNNNLFWSHMRAGTIIVLKNRNFNPSCNSVADDFSTTDGYIHVGLDDPTYFGGGTADLLNCNGNTTMSFASTIPQDIVELLDASGNHVHAFGFRGEDVAFTTSIPAPKFRTGVATGIVNGFVGGISNVVSITDFNSTGNYTSIPGLVGTKGLAQDATTKNFWRNTRQPLMTSQTIIPTIIGNSINLSWAAATDPFPADGLTGYIILRQNIDPAILPFVDPVDGTTYVNNSILGFATIIAHVAHSGPVPITTYTDNNIACGINYYYKIYAYRFVADHQNPNSFSFERGRAYNETNFVQTGQVALPVPTLFNLTGGGSYCTGGSGVIINLSGSQTGVNYQLILNGVTMVGLPVPGTGAPITFGLQTVAGSYTVMATYISTNCTATMSGSSIITVNPMITPTFNPGALICSGGILAALPTSSTNSPSITGIWSPALNNTATTTYTFTPGAGQCAATTTLTITVNPTVAPTFNPVAPICSGGILAALPTSSTNIPAITGTWSPALNNTTTTTYTFTPDAGQCASTTTLTITVNPNITPTFNPVATICSGGI